MTVTRLGDERDAIPVSEHFIDASGNVRAGGAAYDAATGTNQVSVVNNAVTSRIKQTSITQLTAAGQTVATNVSSFKNVGYSFTVASINTNVVVGMQGTIDDSNWFEMSLDSTAVTGASYLANRVTITANGTYYIYARNVNVSQVRFNFISELGGTAATIDVDFMAGN